MKYLGVDTFQKYLLCLRVNYVKLILSPNPIIIFVDWPKQLNNTIILQKSKQ